MKTWKRVWGYLGIVKCDFLAVDYSGAVSGGEEVRRGTFGEVYIVRRNISLVVLSLWSFSIITSLPSFSLFPSSFWFAALPLLEHTVHASACSCESFKLWQPYKKEKSSKRMLLAGGCSASPLSKCSQEHNVAVLGSALHFYLYLYIDMCFSVILSTTFSSSIYSYQYFFFFFFFYIWHLDLELTSISTFPFSNHFAQCVFCAKICDKTCQQSEISKFFYCLNLSEVKISNTEEFPVRIIEQLQKLDSELLCFSLDYVHVPGLTVEGHRASHRLPAADKKCKHAGPPETHIHPPQCS